MNSKTSDPSIKAAIALVAGELGVTAAAITGPRKGASQVVRARQMAAYLCAVDLERSANRLAPIFGRHRTTIDHALRRIEDGRDDPAFDRQMSRLEAQLLSAA